MDLLQTLLQNYQAPALQGQPAANPQATQGIPGSTLPAATQAQIAAMPQWQRGLMGAITGDTAYGANAPAVSRLFNAGMGIMGAANQQPPRPPMGGMPMRGPAPPAQPLGSFLGGSPGLQPMRPVFGFGMPTVPQPQTRNPLLAGGLMGNNNAGY